MTAVEKTKHYTYARRQPELTPCFKIVQGSLNTFIAERSAEGRPLPGYVVKEFDAYLKCGILAYGFLRIVCKDCSEEKIVAFSCKKRGFCPSGRKYVLDLKVSASRCRQSPTVDFIARSLSSVCYLLSNSIKILVPDQQKTLFQGSRNCDR